MKRILLFITVVLILSGIIFGITDDLTMTFESLAYIVLETGYGFDAISGDAKLQTYYTIAENGDYYYKDSVPSFGVIGSNPYPFDPEKLGFNNDNEATYVDIYGNTKTTPTKITENGIYALFMANHAKFFATANGRWVVNFTSEKYLKKDTNNDGVGDEIEENLPVFAVQVGGTLPWGIFYPQDPNASLDLGWVTQNLGGQTQTVWRGTEVGSYDGPTEKNMWGLYAVIGIPKEWQRIEAGNYYAEVTLTVTIP